MKTLFEEVIAGSDNSEESPEEATGKGAASVAKKTSGYQKGKEHGHPVMTVENVTWSRPVPTRETLCCLDGRLGAAEAI